MALNPDTIIRANAVVVASGYLGAVAFGPVVDGEFIVERPTLTLRRGRVNKVSSIQCAFY